MIYAVLIGVLCALVAAGLVRPFLVARRDAAREPTTSAAESRSLLRQLRDLDDDLAAGRIAELDHRRLRSGLEAQAAAALAGPADPPPETDRAATTRAMRTDAGPTTGGRRSRRVVAAGVAVLSAAAVMVLLVRAVDQREPQPETGGSASPAPVQPSTTTGAPSSTGGGGRVTKAALADVEQAVAQVKSHPGQAAAHVELARAYTAAGQPQLASVEYLAATRIDAGDVEANTALGLVAFKAGNARLADSLVTKGLRAHPHYPEALYTRGLIRAMGLHRAAAAARDLRAYQHAAPTGSHRTTVATVLALLRSGAIK
jgi:tetratricopeptide (TPR) repeat protein